MRDDPNFPWKQHIIIVHVALFLADAPTDDEVAFFF